MKQRPDRPGLLHGSPPFSRRQTIKDFGQAVDAIILVKMGAERIISAMTTSFK